MKKIILLISIFISQVSMLIAQSDNTDLPSSEINIVARYNTKNKNAELRFVPQLNVILKEALKYGFIIERAELDLNKFKDDKVTNAKEERIQYKQIGTTKPYNDMQWASALKTANPDLIKKLQLAKDFYDQRNNKEGTNFNIDNGIYELKQAKSREEFELFILVFNALQNKEVAIALGFDFVDSTAFVGKDYLYRAILAKNTSIYLVKSNPFLLRTGEAIKSTKTEVAVKENDKSLGFLWDQPDMVTGVLAERKSKNQDWKALSTVPEISLMGGSRNGYFDSGLVNGIEYSYRFYGFTPFGEKVLFAEGKGTPKDLTPPKAPLFISAKHTKPKEITIKWDADLLEKDFLGFIVARGIENNGNFKVIGDKLIAKDIREFKDTTFSLDETNYYVIQAIDTSGNISSTIPAFVTLIDSIPPKPPIIINANIDSSGIVTIEIELNKEKDLLGYRMFKVNDLTHEWSFREDAFINPDSSAKEFKLIYKDTITLNSLTPYIYYSYMALDLNMNQSELSEFIKLARPDTIPPTTPVFNAILVGKDYVDLTFALSQSPDVFSHILYRSESPTGEWMKVIETRETGIFYSHKDSALISGKMYYYSAQAKDKSGLLSKYAYPMQAKPYDDGMLLLVKDLVIKEIDNKKLLTWNYELKNDNIFYVIYSKDSKDNFIEITRTKSLNFDVSGRKENHYAVKVFSTNPKKQSKLSEFISVPD